MKGHQSRHPYARGIWITMSHRMPILERYTSLQGA